METRQDCIDRCITPRNTPRVEPAINKSRRSHSKNSVGTTFVSNHHKELKSSLRILETPRRPTHRNITLKDKTCGLPEATLGIEPRIRVLQTPALPLGYVAQQFRSTALFNQNHIGDVRQKPSEIIPPAPAATRANDHRLIDLKQIQ